MLIRVSIIGAAGYTGVELIRLLKVHPQVQLKHLISESYANQEVAQVYPHFSGYLDISFSKLDLQKLAKDSDVVFLALPHGKSIPLLAELLAHGCKVIDLSADLRLNNPDSYVNWYQHPAAPKLLLDQAVYGLAEINAAEISSTELIANPGCYPTATILGLAPLLQHKLLDLAHKQPLIIDAKSGVSGAGRSLSLSSHFCEVANNFSAYQVGGIHRHIPEIEQELSKIAKKPITTLFTPYLIPIPRGLMVTLYAPLNSNYSIDSIHKIYTGYYAQRSFIHIASQSRPDLKAVIGSNFCAINLFLDKRTNCLVIISALDNLLKGASGQAMQNMNLMFQLPETTGLQQISIYP